MKNITVLSDPGVDDLVALVLLEKLTKNYTKTLVSTYGNNPAKITSKNAKAFAAFMGNKWQFREGSSLPLNGKIEEQWLDSSQGPDGLWGVSPPVSQKTPKLAKEIMSGRLFSLASLTEVTQLMKTQQINDLVIMGGLFNPREDERQDELNIRLDIEAARWVFENCQKTNITLIPADVANGVYWTLDDIKSIPEANATNVWLKKLLLAGYKNRRYGNGNDFVLYDPLAIYLAFMPGEAIWRQSGVEVIVQGKRRGCTVLSKTNPSCNIATSVVGSGELSRKIFDVVFREQTV